MFGFSVLFSGKNLKYFFSVHARFFRGNGVSLRLIQKLSSVLSLMVEFYKREGLSVRFIACNTNLLLEVTCLLSCAQNMLQNTI